MFRCLALACVLLPVTGRPVSYHTLGDSWKNPCLAAPLKSSPACDTSLGLDARVESILSLLTAQDKVALLVNTAQSVSHLSLPAYQWWNEALHGVGKSPGVTFDSIAPNATSFPQVITTAASFNSTLFHAIGDAVGTEARAFSNVGHAGFTFWAPNVNIFRDPRWGRGQETPGEDPVLTSEYAANFPRGLQDGPDWPKYIKASSCCKHFAAYSLENWGGVDRHHFDAVVTSQDLNDTYLPAFQSCVQRSDASGFMCSYNSVNGVPACANSFLMTETLRNKWGFDGYVTSDCGAVDDVLNNHRYTNTTDDTCVVTLDSGMDIECGDFLRSSLGSCIANGACNASVTDPPLRHLFRVQMRLGLFDPADGQDYLKIGMIHVSSDFNQQLALEAAQQGVVMLKNERNRLPLSKSLQKIVLIGPNANATSVLLGNYEGVPPYILSILDGVQQISPAVDFHYGCDASCSDTSGFADAVTAAQSADAVVVVLGLTQKFESEGHDRTEITFPGHQLDLLTAVCQAASSPVTLVVLSGGALDLTTAKSADCVGAILWAGYPGQAGGKAIAQILFGDVNPSGRLTQTIYPADFVNQVSLFDMGMRPNATSGNPGRTYRFYTGTPVYPFGSGLTFSKFQYELESVIAMNKVTVEYVEHVADSVHDNLLAEIEPVATFEVSICNNASIAGAETVLLFVSPPNAGVNGAPLRQLARSFQKIWLEANECKVIELEVTPRDLVFANQDGVMRSQAGDWRISIGEPIELTATLALL